ncbi:MAG: carboxypeptidase-like regulatory domain-containing protein [Bacteroidetes bacterium]|nr:carboxypeptidase-like regulatory domain-containing protein [Bacteroidota bacterium]
MKTIIYLLLLPLFASAQPTYKGMVISEKDHKPIPFATVGLVKENTGINADENGYFELNSTHPQPNDSLIISTIGYVTQKLSLNKLPDTGIQITLTEKAIALSPVFISTQKNWTKETLNDYRDCGNSFYTSSGYLRQLAQHFSSPQEGAILTRLRICRSTGPLFKPARTIFRIRVYDMDSLTGGPGQDLSPAIIEVKSRNSSISLNLEDYKIQIPHRDYFIAIEWLKIPYNERESFTATGPHKGINITYEPAIGWKEGKHSIPELWEMTYQDKWHRVSNFLRNKTALISAIIKY